MTLLTIVQEAAGSLNQPVPSTVFGSTSGDAVLWRNLAQREGRDLSGRHDWQALIVQQTWTSTATQAQTSALPSDYDHMVPDVVIWDRTGHYPYRGPTSSQDWQTLVSSGVSGGGAGWWRIIGGDVYLYPAPTAGRTFALEYITTKWCQSSGWYGSKRMGGRYRHGADPGKPDRARADMAMAARERHGLRRRNGHL
jgi:hypothetical protein